MSNRRGSTGYGQKFTDEITNDWGGRAYGDVMKGIDAAIAKYPFIDKTKLAAAGGSYGGYFADWLETHTDPVKAIVSHARAHAQVSVFGHGGPSLRQHPMPGSPLAGPEQ